MEDQNGQKENPWDCLGRVTCHKDTCYLKIMQKSCMSQRLDRSPSSDSSHWILKTWAQDIWIYKKQIRFCTALGPSACGWWHQTKMTFSFLNHKHCGLARDYRDLYDVTCQEQTLQMSKTMIATAFPPWIIMYSTPFRQSSQSHWCGMIGRRIFGTGSACSQRTFA